MPPEILPRLADHTARIWRPTTASGSFGNDRRTYELVASDVAVKVNRDTSPAGMLPQGMDAIGRRRIYAPLLLDVELRDVVELVTGPDAPQKWEVDEPPKRPRNHHTQLDLILFRGTLPAATES